VSHFCSDLLLKKWSNTEIYRERGDRCISGECFYRQSKGLHGSRPSAIAKVQVDGELMLTELGLTGDEQAEAKIHGGPDRALCHYPREHYQHWKTTVSRTGGAFVAPRLARIYRRADGKNVFIGDIFRGEMR
jgi:MOSC domain-containing protein YiiM